VFSWFRRSSVPVSFYKLRSRENNIAAKVNLSELAPGIIPYLGLVAYLQLEVHAVSARAAAEAPDLEAKEKLSYAAGRALEKYQEFAAEIRRRHREPVAIMEPYAHIIDQYSARIAPQNWHELVMTVYLVGGLFDDFFAQLAQGISDPYGKQAAQIVLRNPGNFEIASLLKRSIRDNPKTADSLALWGRRLVGDSLLVARSSLVLSDDLAHDEKKIEPVFTELIAAHIKRMEALGLTA
jgi:tRNA-(MS[2]IO[6]A)-hydroxylase (MiaE)-like